MMHNPRWPECDWCANLVTCEEGTCDCCQDKCNCTACVGPYYEDVFPKSKYPEAWAKKRKVSVLALALRDMTVSTQERKEKE
jgi:hypothetical protein